ncbi:MAG: hypothetical protein M3Q48_16495 [Actinomycetota bacterium]|nr:hypothetical protein [Actinomycetota bacterium]
MDGRAAPRVLAGLVAALLIGGVFGALVVKPPPSLSPLHQDTAAAQASRSPAGVSALSAQRDVSAYRGLAAWVDAFDYAPAYHRLREGPLLVPEEVDAMAARGVRTLFLQAARLDARSPEGIVDRELVGRFVRRAHERGLRVVGWYLPKFADLEADLAHLGLIRQFRFEGHRFDGVAVDIEFRSHVRDHAERNRRLVELSRRLRSEAGSEALGAIVYPPVLLEAIKPGYWPDFPWAQLAESFDVWLPMAYWTEIPTASGHREGYRYGEDAVRGVRARLGDPDALVHLVGGVADVSTIGDLAGLVRAARDSNAVGWSVYDYRTTSPSGWDVLQEASRSSP